MNKYQAIYAEDILAAERASIKAVVSGDADNQNKVDMIRGFMELTDRLIAGREEDE